MVEKKKSDLTGMRRSATYAVERGGNRILRNLLSLLVIVLLLGVGSQQAPAATLQVTPDKDNTLYEDSEGVLTNGAGDYLFAGRVAQRQSGRIRRALISFDLQAIPAGANITAVTLRLNMSRSISGSQTVTLHRVQTDWGEGASNASGQEGGGTTPTSNDATWLFNFYDASTWTSQGGDFSPAISASLSVGGTGVYTWGSSTGMVADVQAWVDNPSVNFGWLVKGNESTTTTAKRFDSRQHPVAENRPLLEVEYSLPRADLALSKSVDQPDPKEGDTVTYTVGITNLGPDGASDIEVTDLLPAGVTFVSGSGVPGSYNADTGVWDVGTLANAASGTLTLTVKVDAGTAGTAITNTAAISGTDTSDPVSGNNSAVEAFTVTVLPLADVNDDGAVNLADVILVFQVLSGSSPTGIRSEYAESDTDVDGDGRVGLAEAIYGLEATAGLRSP